MRAVLIVLLTLAISAPAVAQLQYPAISPVVRADGKVTVALRAPQADSVMAVGTFTGSPASLRKGEDGTWAATIGPLEPGIYFYSFNVDGLKIIDPMNRLAHRSLRPQVSMFIVPGTPPLFFEDRDVPRGKVHIHRHRSSTFGDDRSYYVYTPPESGSVAPEGGYPVLYLLHGYTGTEESWHSSGRASFILDNLLSEGEAVPMIVVMPFGYPPRKEGDGDGSWHDWLARVTPRFERYVVEELIPLIDGEYETRTSSKGRAIAGLSMGGGQTLWIGLGNPDLFGWIGAFSSSISRRLHSPLIEDSNRLNEALSLLWIGCGRDDFLYESNVAFIKSLESRGIEHIAHITDGTHSWPVWQRYLHEFAGHLFKQKQ